MSDMARFCNFPDISSGEYFSLDDGAIFNLGIFNGLMMKLGVDRECWSKVELLQNSVKSERHKYKIDHNKDFNIFLQAYFAKNFFKCYASLLASGVEIKEHSVVRDIGCGPGSFSIAYSVLRGERNSAVRLIDGSIPQINSSIRLHYLLNPSSNISVQNSHFSEKYSETLDLGLCSYVFCENVDVSGFSVKRELDRLVLSELIVVDYDYIIDRICQEIPNGVELNRRWRFNIKVPASMSKWLGEESVNVCGARLVRR